MTLFATPELGKLMFETNVTRFIEMAHEFRTIPHQGEGGSSLERNRIELHR